MVRELWSGLRAEVRRNLPKQVRKIGLLQEQSCTDIL